MNFSNAWLHPKSTILGLLIFAGTTFGVLSAQGISLGKVGTGTVVGLASALVAAFVGLLSNDKLFQPADPAPANPGSTQKLSGLMLIAVLLMGTLASTAITGCTQAQKISVAQEIVNWSPTFISTADLVNASIMALDPSTALILGPITLAINTLGPDFQKAAQAYLLDPNQTNIQLLQALIVQIQQDTNAALLASVKITNPTSQAKATQQINLIATIVNTLLGLIQSISSHAQLAAMSQHITIPLAAVRPYMDVAQEQRAISRVSMDLALNDPPTINQFFKTEAALGF